jgi:hypothetical protein
LLRSSRRHKSPGPPIFDHTTGGEHRLPQMRNTHISIGGILEIYIYLEISSSIQEGQAMEHRAYVPLLDAEITAASDAIIRGDVNPVAIDTSRKTEDLLDALKNNRSRLKILKDEYMKLVKIDGGVESPPSRQRQMVFHEIIRIYGAMEGIKDELTQRGAHFDIDILDNEHPNAAFARITAPPAANQNNSFGIMFWYIVLSTVIFFLWFFTANDWRHLGDFWQQHATSPWPDR